MRSNTTWLAILVSLLLFPVESSPGEQVTSSLSVQSGPINAVVIQKDGARLSIYGVSDRDSPRMEQVLLTHHRRDVAWAARLAVEAGAAAVEWTLAQPGNEEVRSVNAVVGETNDGLLNDIRARHVTVADARRAIESAADGQVEEGVVGAVAGTVAFGFKAGIGKIGRAHV